MANSPSHRWEDGRIVERAIETNRWSVDRYGNPVEDEPVDADTKQVEKAAAENKAVSRSKTTKK